ncbi:MAG TPA: sterol desaturase [Planctomycetales bacterium]|jgi:lathosterol oxidase|nr:sterol desaturase [Planctomycetales bacterium]
MSADVPKPAPRHFGSGWISGALSVVLAGIGLGAVLCFHFPSYLTVPEARAAYPLQLVRAVLHLVLVAGFLLGFASVMLRQNKTLGLIGMGLVLIAALLGGSRVPIEGNLHDDYYLGLDYFLLNLVVFSLIFIPLEKLFGRLQQGGVFRQGWRTDLIYFFVSSLMVQVTTLLTLKPAFVLFSWAVHPAVQATVRSQPLWVQFIEIVLLADLVQYWIHRTFHVVPWLWRFHAVHHSTEVMDWMSGSRLHLVDLAVTRAAIYVPAYILGFSDWVLYAYIGFVAVHSTFIHTNLRFRFGPLRWLFTTPQFHHWHHGCEPEAIDKNFAVHVPILDLLFGTFHLPGSRWPKAYGVHNNDVPAGYLAQWIYPFLPPKKQASPGPVANAPVPSSGE